MAKKPSLHTLGQLIVEKRGDVGVRAAAKEIGISAATLSRVENGHLPDLQKFSLICRWLDLDPNQILGVPASHSAAPKEQQVKVQFKKKDTSSKELATALAQMILAAQRALAAQKRE